MKSLLLLFTFLIFTSLHYTYAQDVSIAEPEFINSAIYVNGDKSVQLEKAIPYTKSRATIASYATGVGGAKAMSQVKGTSSPIRIKKSDNYTFIIKVYSNAVDPAGEVTIMKLTSTKKKRTYDLASIDMLGQSKEGDIDYIPFEAKKYGNSSYLLQINTPLESGEYAISLRNVTDVLNCFGVDEN